MRQIFWTILMVVGVVAGAAAADRIVAVVNDQVITLTQLEERTSLNLRQLGMTSPNAQQRAAVSKRTLSGLIDEELQRQYATAARIKMTPQELAATKAKAVESLGGQSNWNALTAGLEQTAYD